MSESNPYQPPRSQVADVPVSTHWGEFIADGRSVEAGQGWAWIASGFGLFRKRAGAWIGITVVLVALLIVLNFIPFIGPFANMLLMPVYLGGLLLGCKALEDDGEFGLGQARGFPRLLQPAAGLLAQGLGLGGLGGGGGRAWHDGSPDSPCNGRRARLQF